MSRLAILLGLGLVTVGAVPAPVAEPPASRLRVPEGFTITQVAGEPQVRFPMFAVFDDRGRLFVAESSGLDLYAELKAGTRKCRILLLEDRDGDGKFETVHVFADKLVFPMGLAWRDGKLYVADPPDVVVYEDTDGDGRADRRTVILSSFGHIDNGSLHGLVFGPDGWLYLTMGDPDGYRLPRKDGSVLEGKTGALLRCRPDGSDPEVLCGGFENLVEIAFTPRGEILGTDNWYQLPSGGIRDALVHLVEGGLYPTHNAAGTPLPATGDPLPPVTLFPAVALSGLMRYDGTAFPPTLQGNLFSAQHNARKVVRHVLVPNGTTFRARNFDFVSTEDPDFHPSDVLEAADGSLLVVDTGSWYVHHCPTGRIRKTQAPGGIYRVSVPSAIPPADPWGLKLDWAGATPEQLVARLAGPSAVADRAQHTLAGRGQAAVSALARSLEPSANRRARQRAVWALVANADESAALPLRKALGDADPDIVAAAARGLGRRRDRPSASELCRLLQAPAPPVRLAAAEALAHCGDVQDLPAVWKALAGQPDRFLEHALIYAAHWLADVPALQKALADPSPQVQKAALLLLDQPPRPRDALASEPVLRRVTAADAGLRQTALRILSRHPEWAGQALALLRGWLREPTLAEQDQAALQNLVLAFQAQPAVQQLVADALSARDGKVPPQRRALLLETLAQTSLPEVPASWRVALGQALQSPAPAVRTQAVRALAVLQIPTFDEQLARLAEDNKEPPALRLEALRAVVARRPQLSAGSFELLMGQLSDADNPLGRLAAAEILGRARLSDDQLARLLKAIRGDSLIAPTVVLPALERSTTAASAGAVVAYLAEAIRSGWRPSDQELAEDLAALPPAVRTQSGPLRELLRQSALGQRARLAKFEPLLKGGNPEQGRAVFFGKKVPCATCHRIGNEGGQVGPDLTRIGATRSGQDILESILLPSSTIAQGYEPYVVATADGRLLTGVIARQTPEILVLRDSSGAEVRVRKDQVQAMRRLATSIMPEGLERSLTTQEFRDLLAFLKSLK